MPKVINEDIIAKIAGYARKKYSKSATARELGLDRATVMKYWPREETPEEKKGEQPTLHLSLNEEFRLLNKKVEADHGLESLLSKIKDCKWETESLETKEKDAIVSLDFLSEKLDKATSVTEVEQICALANEMENNVTALLAENEPLGKQRREREVKKEEDLMQDRLKEFAWVSPTGGIRLRRLSTNWLRTT